MYPHILDQVKVPGGLQEKPHIERTTVVIQMGSDQVMSDHEQDQKGGQLMN